MDLGGIAGVFLGWFGMDRSGVELETASGGIAVVRIAVHFLGMGADGFGMDLKLIDRDEIKLEDLVAYKPSTAALLVDLCPRTIRNEIIRGNLIQSHYGLIMRNELIRWLENGMKRPELFPVRRRKRKVQAHVNSVERANT